MGSKGRIPPHLRGPLQGSDMMHPDPFGPGFRPPPGNYSPFDMLPPPELMEQKLDTQLGEMRQLANENQRLAATHSTLRQELAAAQQELQRFQIQIGAIKNDREQHMRGLINKISKMEVDLQAAEPINTELQQARTNAQNLIAARQELITEVQQLTQDLQKTHLDVQQVPALMSELEGLRQEYQHCRAKYDYEKKLYNADYESLHVMENNYISMARELEKLRAELASTAAKIERGGAPYGGTTGYKENEAAGHHSVGQNAYEDGYNVPQGGVLPSGSAPPFAGGAPGPARAPTGYEPVPAQAGYDAPRGPVYDAQRGSNYNATHAEYEHASAQAGYDAPRGPVYDAQRGPNYNATQAEYEHASAQAGYDAPRGPSYDAQRGLGYNAPPRGVDGSLGHMVAPGNSVTYGSATPPTYPVGAGYEAPPPRGGNPVFK